MREADEGVRTQAAKLEGIASSDETGETWLLN